MSFGDDVSELVANSKEPLIAKSLNWPRVPLGDVASILNGFPWKSERFTKASGAPLIRIRDVTTGQTETRYDGPITEGYWVEVGDLLVGMDGDFNVRRWNAERGLLNQRVCKITAKPECYDTRLLEYLLPAYLRLINQATSSVTVKHLSSRTLTELPLPLPPLAEQRRIVAKLDALTARLARARAELDRVPVLAANLRKETLRNAFGQGAPDVPVRDLISDIRYGTAKKCDYGGGAVSVLRIPNVQGGRIDLTDMKSADFDDKELAKLRLMQGDVLVIRSNGSLDLVGRSAIVDDSAAGMLFAGYLIRMRVDPAKCLPEYLHHFLQAPACRETLTMGAKSTSGVNNVNAQQLQALAVPLLDLATQASLIVTIEQAFTRADRLEAEAARARALLDRLEAAILARAFRGELVPQDPADEPASTLLARIRAKRAAAPKAKRGRKAKAA